MNLNLAMSLEKQGAMRLFGRSQRGPVGPQLGRGSENGWSKRPWRRRKRKKDEVRL